MALDKEVDLGDETKLVELAGELGPVPEGNEGEEFRVAIKEEDSLKEWRELGTRGERGFKWKDGILVKSAYVTWEEFRDVVIVPKGWRCKIMVLGRDKLGHLGAEKVSRMVGRHFLWSGMNKDPRAL